MYPKFLLLKIYIINIINIYLFNLIRYILKKNDFQMLAESMKCFRFDKNVPRFTTAVLAAVNKSNQKNVTRTFFSSKVYH